MQFSHSFPGAIAALAWLVSGAIVASADEHVIPSSAIRDLTEASVVSRAFAVEAASAARTIPDPIWEKVVNAGWRVVLVEQVVDAAPDLRGTAPRGWPQGWLWEHTDAVHLPSDRQLIIAEKRRNQLGQIVNCNRVGGVLRHELGHAFDMISGDGQSFRSALPEFLSAYHNDIQRMTDPQRQTLAYYLQDSDAGRQETFAEAFGVLLGGGSDSRHAEVFQASFSQTLAYVRRIVADYNQAAQAAEAAEWTEVYGEAEFTDETPRARRANGRRRRGS